jgi:hypothetical protein
MDDDKRPDKDDDDDSSDREAQLSPDSTADLDKVRSVRRKLEEAGEGKGD